jgi:hypothetical protein
VCAFHQGKAHEVYQRHKPSQEIGAKGHPAFVAGEESLSFLYHVERDLGRAPHHIEGPVGLLARCLEQGEFNASGLGFLFSDLQPAFRLRFDYVQVATLFCDPDLA